MLKALVYAYVDCPACGGTLPLKAWMIESGFDDDGHACELEIEIIECPGCGVLEDGEELERIVDDILDAVYDQRTVPIGEILAYYPGLI